MNHEHVLIEVIDAEPAGSEHVPARKLESGEWEVIRSPLYATEVAAGDIIKVIDADKGKFEITSRGMNICIQFYLGESEANDVKATSRLAEEIDILVKPINGRIDAATAGLISLTIPVASGFSAIEGVLELAVEKSPGAQWQYANVYDPVTGDPLGWWS
jgi:hypothetical protein